jgi:hypothetical protein
MVHTLSPEQLSLLFKLIGRRVNTNTIDEVDKSDASKAEKSF